MKAEKSDPAAPAFVAIPSRREVPVFAITEQEAKSMDHQQLYGGSAIAFGTLFCGMFVNMLLCAAPIDWHLGGVLVVVWLVAWLFGTWMLWQRRSLLSTLKQQSQDPAL